MKTLAGAHRRLHLGYGAGSVIQIARGIADVSVHRVYFALKQLGDMFDHGQIGRGGMDVMVRSVLACCIFESEMPI